MTNKPPQLIQPVPERAWLPIRLAATVDVSLVNCPDTINGVLLGPDRDRVLLTGQTLAPANGIYALTESGADTVRTISANQTTTETIAAGRLVYVTVTGTVTVTGSNGQVTADAPGFLAPLSGPVRLDITGGASGGTVTYKATVGLTRTADADVNADFAAGKVADVKQGTNAGIWQLQGPVSPLVISNALPLVFLRTFPAAQPVFNPTAAPTSAPPGRTPLGFVVALTTSLGVLGSSVGSVNGLI